LGVTFSFLLDTSHSSGPSSTTSADCHENKTEQRLVFRLLENTRRYVAVNNDRFDDKLVEETLTEGGRDSRGGIHSPRFPVLPVAGAEEEKLMNLCSTAR
jgi:hypothetical protein